MASVGEMTRRLLIPLAGLAAAVLALVAGIAIAKSDTVLIAKGTVTPQGGMARTESIVVNGHGFALYWLSGDSARHPKCESSQCMGFWPPMKVGAKAHLTAQPGIKGKLGTWKHNGFTQLTLGGHPLYMFSQDKSKHDATGEGVVSFGGTWHVARPGGGSSTSQSKNTTTTTSSGYSYGTTSSTAAGSTTTTTSSSGATTSTPCVGYYC